MKASPQPGWQSWFIRSARGGVVNPWVTGFTWLLALLLIAAIFAFSFSQLIYAWNWEALWRYREKLWAGWLATVGISLAALVLSTLLGTLVALARRSRLLLLPVLARLYVEAIRGTPLLVQLLIFYYVVASALGLENRYVLGTVALSLFAGAYMSEIFRAALESIGRSQWEAARAVGFTPAQTYRYVVLPQAWRQVLPPLAGQFASLIKDSSLLSVIAISELTLNSEETITNTLATFECYAVLTVGYLVLTLPISLWSRHLESRAQYET